MDLLVLICLIFGLSFGHAATLSSADMAKLTKLDGTAFKTDKDKVLLYFWATWCPDCKEKLAKEFPKLQLPPQVELVTVNTDKDIDRTKHLALESAHPSPFSAHNGFFGSKPFSKTNTYLKQHGEEPIDWL